MVVEMTDQVVCLTSLLVSSSQEEALSLKCFDVERITCNSLVDALSGVEVVVSFPLILHGRYHLYLYA